MRVLGLISGTSHDGIDAAVVDFTGDENGDETADELVGQVHALPSTPYAPALRAQLRAALPPAAVGLAQVCALDTLIGQAFADAAAAAITAAGPVDAICSHGQTVYHWVEGATARGTLQLGQPAWIAERTGTTVIADVRARDIAAGGHGAPLVAGLDALLLAGVSGRAGALNLGGIANVTVPDADGELRAFDTGPANALIDAAVLRTGAHPRGVDVDGAIAATGRVDDGLLTALLDEPYYRRPAPKSTGKELFNDAYLSAALDRFARPVAAPDLLATLTALTADTVADAVRATGVDTLVVSGGGWANPTLIGMLRARLPGVRLSSSAELGAPPETKEAIAFALIGWQSLHGLAGSAPASTGARGPRVLGAIVPGTGPLRLPAPRSAMPTRMRLITAGGTP